MMIATQAAEDILNSRIGPLLIQSCPTRILLPNRSARSSACRPAYEALGLTEDEIFGVSQLPRNRGYFFQRESEGARPFDLLLEGAELAMCGRSRPEHLRLMDKVLEEHGLKGFWKGWLKEMGEPIPEEYLTDTEAVYATV
jgi:type IV secretion system protein VirB4